MAEPVFVERDISWLHFNGRVLQEATDKTVPLYERIKFLAIYSSNLDEFYRVRVSSLRSFRKMKDVKKKLEIKPKKILKDIRAIVGKQQEEFGRIFNEEILPELHANNIHFVTDEDYNNLQQEFARAYFKEHLESKVVPRLVFEEDIDIFLDNKTLYLVVQLDPEYEKIALLPVPEDTERFVVLPGSELRHDVTFVEDIMRFNVSRIFPQNEIHGIYEIKISRDAELYLGDEFTGDLIKRLEERIKERPKGLPTRFLYDQAMPEELVRKLRKTLDISKHDLIPGARYHNFNDFFSFPDPTCKPGLHDTPMPPLPYAPFEGGEKLLDVIADGDRMLHFPYHSYHYIPQLISQAAEDPGVQSIRITLYRVSSQSAVATALMKALEHGKDVFAFIEAKARFDEETNLFWGRKLQEAGAQVRYSFPGIKVHAKLLQIAKRSFGDLTYYTYLGTGNFNEKTATIYADHAMLTANRELGEDVRRVFEMLQGKILVPQCSALLVSPFNTRPGFMELIDREIAHARDGKEAWMIIKMNSLQDSGMIQKLYAASQAGVRIQLIVRGICSLVPGIPGLSETIEVRSIIDRFLEHARVYIFANDGEKEIYLSSADWMTRNLDRRVEVVFPVRDWTLQQEIFQIIRLQLADNCKARAINAEQNNAYLRDGNSSSPVRGQTDTYDLIRSGMLVSSTPLPITS